MQPISTGLKIGFIDGNIQMEFEDIDACAQIMHFTITPEDFFKALAHSYVHGTTKMYNLGRIGKMHEHKQYEFELDRSYNMHSKNDLDALKETCYMAMHAEGLTQEWVADQYYNRQDSFFRKGDKEMARVTIRRWVTKI